MNQKSGPTIYRRQDTDLARGNLSYMEKSDLVNELESLLEKERKTQQEVDEKEKLIHELELHQIELEIQNREVIESFNELEGAKNKYVNLFDSAPVGYISLNNMGKVLEINLTAAKLLNKEKAEILGKCFSSWISKDYKRSYSNHINECLLSDTAERKTIEVELQIPGIRTPLFVELHTTISFDYLTQKKIINVALIDLTENKKTEMLETRARELYQEKNLRENYITALSHDLRTPLTSSRLCAQLLQTHVLDDKQRKLFHMMIDEIDRADRMIKELLNTNKINGPGNLPIIKSEFDLCELTRFCIEQFMYLHSTSIIQYEGEDKLTGHWSYDGVHRIIENLIFNALKYGSKETPITVTVTRKVDQAILSVHNMGNPISLRDQKKIFEAFTRTKSATKGPEHGWGLGLNLVNNLIKSHNGTLLVKSNDKEGTTFTVTLPIV